jgi:Arc/MetJ-type ribon-helix-helix transcriptional regulator
MAHLQVEIPEDVNAAVNDAVGRGEFASGSAVVTAALQLWQNERTLQALGTDHIRAKWDEAITADGPYHDPDTLMDRLEAKYKVSDRG